MNPTHASPNLKRSMRLFFLAAAMVIFALIDARPAGAATYDVNLSFTGGGTASLVGTVDLPLGNYTIMNGAPDPFTAVNLILTVNGTPFSLVQANTSLITGTGQFLINANASTLIFNTANANAGNPADLRFQDVSTNDQYITWLRCRSCLRSCLYLCRRCVEHEHYFPNAIWHHRSRTFHPDTFQPCCGRLPNAAPAIMIWCRDVARLLLAQISAFLWRLAR